MKQVEDAVEKGGKIVTGGKRLDREGLFYEPTVLRDIDSYMKIMQEETFGPLAPVQKSLVTKKQLASLTRLLSVWLPMYLLRI